MTGTLRTTRGLWVVVGLSSWFAAGLVLGIWRNPTTAMAQTEQPAAETARGDDAGSTTGGTTGNATASEQQSLKSAESSNGSPTVVRLESLTRLSLDHDVWIDLKRKRVIVGGKVCLDRGMLEMFACPQGTKEHESIVALNAKAYQIHAGLLAIGATPGRPVRYQPNYSPAEGPKIQVMVQWREDGKPRSVRAQDWIRQTGTDKQMEHDWVFAGSGFWKDTATGKEHYLAEGGEVICVSNFGTAMLDLPIQSSQDNAALMFEAFTERIPPVGTPVRLVLSEIEPSKEAGRPGSDQPSSAQRPDVQSSNVQP